MWWVALAYAGEGVNGWIRMLVDPSMTGGGWYRTRIPEGVRGGAWPRRRRRRWMVFSASSEVIGRTQLVGHGR